MKLSLKTVTVVFLIMIEIVCNFRKCRKHLPTQAWVTICSHAFCVEHGQKEFRKGSGNCMICPACGTELRDKFDVIQAELQPCETYRSIVLAGMKPDVIMDIAMRAMSFWSYQMEQETLYQESIAKHLKEKMQCNEEMNQLNLHKLKAELETCKRKVANLQEECSNKKKQAEELSACLEEKTRKIQKLTYQLDAQKRKDIRSNNYESHSKERFNKDHSSKKDRDKFLDITNFVDKRLTPNEFVFRPVNESPRMFSPKTPIFDFRKKNKHNDSNFRFRPVIS